MPLQKKSYRLDRIELYANSDIILNSQQELAPSPTAGPPIKTVKFEYSSGASDDLCANLPNSSDSQRGKLTLKKVSFFYNDNGLNGQDRKRPYLFDYAYADASQYPGKYKTGVDNVTAGYDAAFTANQNPAYSTHLLDAWGNYQYDGQVRANDLKTWVNQRPGSAFDPAAWQLKKITLPTGGEIHVQYEQDDYSYVQNKRAHAMVRLKAGQTSDTSFDLDLTEVLDPNSADFTSQLYQLKKAIKDYYVDGSEKIFFKFLYNLQGSSMPVVNTCNAEYIKGYIDVKTVEVVSNTIRIGLGTSSGSNIKLPRNVCLDFLRTQRMGKLNSNGICDPAANGISNNQGGPAQLIRYIMARASTLYNPGSVCGQLNPQLSYFRIPMVTPKKGGGLRVKRLLTFDKGLDNQPVLYGSEYIYRTENPDRPGEEISSGVATTEPSAMREENILVSYLPRKTQGTISKAVAGEDLKQGEGPLGESVLPGPSVGYSRVVVRNIHSGISTPGYSVNEFATAQQYPMLTKSTDINQKKDFLFIWLFLATSTRNNVQATQGYSFILNNMHGQIKRRASYAGSYTGLSTPNAKPVSEQKYTYFEPPREPANAPKQAAQPIPVTAGRRQSINDLFPGKEIDMTYAQHSVKDKMNDINFELDFEVAITFFGLLPYPTVKATYVTTEAELATHVTTKVVRYPAVVQSIESTQDGITHTTTNLAFDQFTGQPVLTKSNDEFQGGYLQESTMAAWVHPELGPKAARENSVVSGTMALAQADGETWLSFTGTACAGLGSISQGDQLQLNNHTDCLYFAEAPDFANKRVRLYPVMANMTASSVPTVPPITESITRVTVLSSGRTNQLTASAGSTTYHLNQAFASINKTSRPAYQAASAPNPAACNGTSFLTDLRTVFTSAPSRQLEISAEIELTGTYYCVNMSAYADKMRQCTSCTEDPARATITSIKLRRQLVQGQLRVIITSFQVVCPGGNCTISN